VLRGIFRGLELPQGADSLLLHHLLLLLLLLLVRSFVLSADGA